MSSSRVTFGDPRRPDRGFSFIEILIGIIILVVGLVPLMVAYTVSTRDTRVSISQVQAINHASNLLEALRAFGSSDFKKLVYFPKAMEQRRGGSNEWVASTEAPEADDQATGPGAPANTNRPKVFEADSGTTAGGGSADKNFEEFKKLFFAAKNPIVPNIDRQFKRIFQVVSKEEGYLTLVSKVSWDEIDPSKTGGAHERVIELRTVVADPYLFASNASDSGSGGVPPGTGSGPGTGTGTTPAAASPRGPGLPLPGGGLIR